MHDCIFTIGYGFEPCRSFLTISAIDADTNRIIHIYIKSEKLSIALIDSEVPAEELLNSIEINETPFDE